MLVYRFMSLRSGLDSLQKARLRIGRLLELNDPYDCAPRMINLAVGVDENIHVKTLADMVGILSYSATIRDPVVWSHYADSHRGLAFAFDFVEPSDGLIKVEYEADRSVLDFHEVRRIADGGGPVEFVQHIVSEGFRRKAKSWHYEQEYRMFVHLDACDPEGDSYFRPLPIPRLRAVILGTRCMANELDIERSLRAGRLPESTPVCRAQKNPDTYEMIVQGF